MNYFTHPRHCGHREGRTLGNLGDSKCRHDHGLLCLSAERHMGLVESESTWPAEDAGTRTARISIVHDVFDTDATVPRHRLTESGEGTSLRIILRVC